MRIYAAVIEWPAYFADAEPALILAPSIEERAGYIAAEITDTAVMLTDSEWLEAIGGTESDDWRDWMDALEATSVGRPFVTLYTTELPA